MYKDIYSALYTWSLKQWHGDDYLASLLTAFTLAGAVGLNMVLVIGLCVVAYGPDPFRAFFPRWMWPILVALTFLAHYAAFVRHDRYSALAQRFHARPTAERRRITMAAWVYLITSYALAAGFGLLMTAVSQ